MHTPVLLDEVLTLTAPQTGETVVDCTLGLGGHAEALLAAIGPTGQLIGLDADTRNLTLAKERLQQYTSQLTLHHANFRQLSEIVAPASADIVLFDLGISSPHFDDATRGFSFRLDGPLDMRLDTEQSLTAAEIVNTWTLAELTKILSDYGEIRTAAKVATQIVAARPLSTTTELAAVITAGRILPQVFQALRMAVNDELAVLTAGLTAALQILRPAGRLAVISFHSLEDRLVKNFLRDHKRTALTLLTKKVIMPTNTEITSNPRARSAKLRAAQKI